MKEILQDILSKLYEYINDEGITFKKYTYNTRHIQFIIYIIQQRVQYFKNE